MSGEILLVDDEVSLCEMLQAGLRRRGFQAKFCTSPNEALALVESPEGDAIDAVVTDLRMREMDGIDLCGLIVAKRPNVPVLVLTAFGSFDSAIAAIRAGAYDYLTKPVQVESLAIALRRAVAHRALREEVKILRQQVNSQRVFNELLGQSPPMRELRDLLARIAESDASVLITGESGSGKEVVARSLHQCGARKDKAFVAINIAAMPETLLESELFGHTRGAFTDAKNARAGHFVQASGGTIFLDEIGEMPLALQPKLLRVLEERKVRPLGSTQEIPIDVRVIAATNRDLQTAVEDKRFREDLYFRLNVIHVPVPPLRARAGDILLLAQHFLRDIEARTQKGVVGISSAAAERLSAYHWPGNVRELRNAIERAVALTRFESIAVDDLPETVRNFTSSHIVVAGDDPSELVQMEEVERRYIARVLSAVAGNKTAAAAILGFDRKTLYRKLEQYRIDSQHPSSYLKGEE